MLTLLPHPFNNHCSRIRDESFPTLSFLLGSTRKGIDSLTNTTKRILRRSICRELVSEGFLHAHTNANTTTPDVHYPPLGLCTSAWCWSRVPIPLPHPPPWRTTLSSFFSRIVLDLANRQLL